jgi:hypothetical protein
MSQSVTSATTTPAASSRRGAIKPGYIAAKAPKPAYLTNKKKIASAASESASKVDANGKAVVTRKRHPSHVIANNLKKIVKDMSTNGRKTGITTAACVVMESLINTFIEKVTQSFKDIKRARGKKYARKPTYITEQEVITAITLMIETKELREHTIAEATKAIGRFTDQVAKDAELASKNKDKGLDIKKKPVRKTVKAGLNLSVSEIYSIIKEQIAPRKIYLKAAIGICGMVDYLVCEILDFAISDTIEDDQVRISNQSIYNAISNDPEMKNLLLDVSIPGTSSHHIKYRNISKIIGLRRKAKVAKTGLSAAPAKERAPPKVKKAAAVAAPIDQEEDEAVVEPIVEKIQPKKKSKKRAAEAEPEDIDEEVAPVAAPPQKKKGKSKEVAVEEDAIHQSEEPIAPIPTPSSSQQTKTSAKKTAPLGKKTSDAPSKSAPRSVLTPPSSQKIASLQTQDVDDEELV